MSFKSSVLQNKDVIIFLYSCFFSLLTVLCDCLFQSGYVESNIFVYFTIGYSLSYLCILCLEYPIVRDTILEFTCDIIAIYTTIHAFVVYGYLVFHVMLLSFVLTYMMECGYTYIICPGFNYLTTCG